MKPSYADDTGEYNYFHTLVGYYPQEHFEVVQRVHGEWDDRWSHFKIQNFLGGPNNVIEMEKYLGFPDREIICTFSKVRNAVTYHLPFGLVLSGEPRLIFNNDSGLSLSDQGVYVGNPYAFTTSVTLQELAAAYSKKYVDSAPFVWDEVVLKPGAKILGAFHDPNPSPNRRRQSFREAPENEYEDFLAKCESLQMPILEIDARLK